MMVFMKKKILLTSLLLLLCAAAWAQSSDDMKFSVTGGLGAGIGIYQVFVKTGVQYVIA
jgi:hypothetical protein